MTNTSIICTGRICSIQKNTFKIIYNCKEITAVLKGSFYNQNSNSNLCFPVVGDFVKFAFNDKGKSQIKEIIPRKNILTRPDQSGHAIGYVKNLCEQPMIANFDYGFILTSLNSDYSTNRIARYVSMILQSGAIPVVILTKSDLCPNVQGIH